LGQPVLDYLDRPSVGREIQLAGINRRLPPFSLAQLPVSADGLPTWYECLTPAGFHEALGMPLFEAGGPYLGMLTLLFASGDRPSDAMRDRLSQFSPVIARGVSPMRSMLTTARIVQGATAGAVLNEDGTIYPAGRPRGPRAAGRSLTSRSNRPGDAPGRPCLSIVHVADPRTPSVHRPHEDDGPGSYGGT